ncbi:MAG: hypothetical protein FJZ11_01860, partial [Candidatus Omnitrophica bacterium]|nr:hypothetical protein [Candidatus Omnitrophota bacterium]
MKTDNIFKKIDLVFACFCLFLVFFSLVIYSNESVYQLDIWLHLRTGEWIFANNAIPHQDIYSFVYFGNKWLDHEWLFQVITYCFFAASGFPGLLLMQTIVSVIVFLIFLFIGYRTKEYLISLVPLLLCLYLFRIRFMRPEIFSLLFLAVYLLIIDRYLHSKWFPFVLIPVQILWVNMHGFFFIGPLLILLLVIGDFIKSKIKLPLDWNASHKLDDHTRKKLICLFLYLILACLVNPYFWEGALYPLKIFFSLSGESKVFFKDIVELRPPITIERGMFAKIAASNYLIHYIILVIISLLSFRLNKKNTDIFHIVIWVFFFILATISIRNVAFFGFIAYFIFSQNMRESFSLPPKTSLLPSEKVRYVLKWLLTIFIIMFLLTDVARFLNARFFIFDNYEFSRQFGGSTKFIFPEKAVDFILANKIKGNIYNEFNSGAYLIGRCSPGIKVFIDGRTEAYDVNFYKEYARIMDGDTALLEEKLKKYDLKVALLNSALSEVPAAVLNYFYNHADWKLVFFDEFGLVFLKDVKENKAIIDRFTIDLRNWQP